MKTFSIFLLFLLASFSINARAQSETPTRLALEVTYASGVRPAYQPVPKGVWYGGFQELPGWKAPAGFLPVQAVHIDSQVEGAGVRVVVTVNQGKELFEKQSAVGSYLLREGERKTLYELTGFGLTPFEVAVVRVEPKSGSLPAVKSEVASIAVERVEPVDETFPSFKVTLRNASAKNVSALFIEMYVDGRRRISAMPHNADFAPLIPAGEVYEYKRQMNNNAEPKGASYEPVVPLNQSLLIEAVVFDDGSFEGDAAMAARYRAYSLGRRTQLKRLITRFQAAINSETADAKAVLNTLREEVNALDTEASLAAFSTLLNDFQGSADPSQLKTAIQVVMFELKKEALRRIDEFAAKQPLERESLRNWLTTMRDQFQKSNDYLKKL